MKDSLNEFVFSNKYKIRKLCLDDVKMIYDLCKDNKSYYQYCPPFVTFESIKEDLEALPPGVAMDQKYFVGYFDNEELVAIMDLIFAYPQKDIVFIGLFMLNKEKQGKGIGSVIIDDLKICLNEQGYMAIHLAWIKGNLQAEHFWLKNGFYALEERNSLDGHLVIYGECILKKKLSF